MAETRVRACASTSEREEDARRCPAAPPPPHAQRWVGSVVGDVVGSMRLTAAGSCMSCAPPTSSVACVALWCSTCCSATAGVARMHGRGSSGAPSHVGRLRLRARGHKQRDNNAFHTCKCSGPIQHRSQRLACGSGVLRLPLGRKQSDFGSLPLTDAGSCMSCAPQRRIATRRRTNRNDHELVHCASVGGLFKTS